MNREDSKDHPPRIWLPRAQFRCGRRTFALGLVIAFFVFATVVWVNVDSVPPLWDQAQYLYESELLYHTLEQHGLAAFAWAFSDTLKIKAPLITALPLPFYFLLGESHLSARYVNLVFIVLGSWYLFRLGEMVAGRRAALLSVVSLNTFPLVAGMSRQFLVEYGLMTLVIMWMYYLMRWRNGEERSSSWALGIVLGFGMLMKVTFPLYVAVPTALMLAEEILRYRKLRPKTLVNLCQVAALAFPIAGIWYFKNLRSILGFVRKAGYGEWAQPYGTGSVFSMRTVGTYWLGLINFGIGAYWLLLLVAVACWIGLGGRRGENRSGVARDHLYLLLAWWIVPWLALTFAVNKDIRYSVPYLPALALLLSAGWAEITRRRLGLAALGLIAAAGVLNYSHYSFASGRAAVELRAAGLIFLSQNLTWAHPPTAEHWPNENVVQLVTADSKKLGIAQPIATALFSHPRLSAHNLNYLAALRESPVRFNTCNFQAPESSSELASRVQTQSDYLLTKSGFPGETFLNVKNVAVLNLLQEEGLPFDRIGAVALPDQSEVTIFRHSGRGYRVWRAEDDYRSTHDLDRRPLARFGDSIALMGSNVAILPRGLRLNLVWECTAKMDEDYRVFVHAFDAGGRVYANADHYPARGNKQTSQWKIGDFVEEEVWLPQPPPAGLRIYVGWYRVAQRSQLPIAGGGAPEAGEANAVRVY